MTACAVVVLWVFFGTTGWATYDSYDSLASCKNGEKFVQRRITEKKFMGAVDTICLPTGMEPK